MSTITPKSTDQDSELWASYATAIAGLADVSIEGGTQRLHIAPLSYHCLVSAIQADEQYENYMVYQFGNSIPQDDHPILDINGNFTDAYWTYITQIDQNKLFNSGTVTAAATATAELKTAGTTLMSDIAAARASFPIDCPPDATGKNIDPISGSQIQFAQYLSEFHPEIAADQLAQKDATSRLNEILNTASSNPRVAQYQKWMADFQNGVDNSVFHNGFNQAVEVAEPLAISKVAQAPKSPSTDTNAPPFYDPLFTIGGNLQKDIDSWTSTFPQNYSSDPSTYLKGASLHSISKENLASNTWEQFGFSTSTSTSGSSGWIFWGDMSTTTTTTNTHNLNLTSSDITSSLNVRAWGIGTYPVLYGAWYHDLLTNFPDLNASAWSQNPNIALNIAEKYTTVIVGYGIELTFTLSSQAIQKLVQARSDAESSNSGVSIFGCIYNNDNSSSSSNSSNLTDLKIDTQTGTVTIVAKDNKLPIVLAAIADRVEKIPTPPKV